MVNTILKEADLFCPNSVRINFTIYLISYLILNQFAIVHAYTGATFIAMLITALFYRVAVQLQTKKVI
ncbi:hypothetical protein LBS_04245 [Latilactobacillus sakei]|nr:hypothetical protein LBS_04245 [Latilactobacillus sakei]